VPKTLKRGCEKKATNSKGFASNYRKSSFQGKVLQGGGRRGGENKEEVIAQNTISKKKGGCSKKSDFEKKKTSSQGEFAVRGQQR